MASVDHAFSISDEDMMMDNSYAVSNKPPIKEIALALSLLVFGVVGIVLGIFMAANHVGGDRAHGISCSLSSIKNLTLIFYFCIGITLNVFGDFFVQLIDSEIEFLIFLL